MRVRDIAVTFVLFALLSYTISAQDAKKDKKTFFVKTNLMVLDDKDQFVEGIKEADIKIFENGVEQKLTSFSSVDSVLNLSLVVDNTGSVRPQLDQVISIAKIIVNNLGPQDEATLIRFVGRENIEIVEPWTLDKNKIKRSFDDLFIQGGQSAVIDALYLASQDIIKRQEAANSKRYAIVLISDGEDRASYYTLKDLFKLIENSDLQIFTVALTKDLAKSGWTVQPNGKTAKQAVSFTNMLAAGSGGTSFILDKKSTAENLRESLKSLMIELRSQYIIGYTATDVDKNTLTRKLTATVADGPNGEKRKAIIKETVNLTRDQ